MDPRQQLVFHMINVINLVLKFIDCCNFRDKNILIAKLDIFEV